MQGRLLATSYLTSNLLLDWQSVGSVALAVLILLVMITVHEFGHYIVGKALKFKINEFSIGFGPAIFKKRSKKTGELFAVRLIPLGGYCAFAGEDGLEETEKDENGNEIKKEPDPNSFAQKKPWMRILVLFAGATMNYLLAFLIICVNFFSYGQTMYAVYEAVPTTEIAEEYCLKDRDIFLSVEGNDLYLSNDLALTLSGRKKGDLVNMVVSRIVGVEGEGESAKNIRETMAIKVMLRTDCSAKNSTDLDPTWQALGIAYEESESYTGYMVATSSMHFGFFETLGRSFVYSFKIAGSIFRVIGELFTGALGINAMGGPVSTIKMTSEVVSRGFRSFLEITGYIGVNLAVFNLLPIPALDGSKIVFTTIEWIRRKPISRKVEAIIHAIGFVLLFGFAILVDVLQFI